MANISATNMKAMVRSVLDRYEPDVPIGDGDLDRLITAGKTEIALQLGGEASSFTPAVEDNGYTYALPVTLLRVLRVEYDGERVEMINMNDLTELTT